MMALRSSYYAESNPLSLQHRLCFTGRNYMKLLFGKFHTRLRCSEFSAVCRKRCDPVLLHTAFGVPLTGSVRLLEGERKEGDQSLK